MPAERFRIIVIGSGPAGIAAVEAARGAGAAPIAIVEAAARLGGECPNWGCLPTKSLLSSVEALIQARRSDEVGVTVPKAGVDFGSLMRREQRIVDLVTGGQRLEKVLESNGARLIRGRAKFTGPNAIDVDGVRYEADRFVIATGSKLIVPAIPGLAETGYLDVTGILRLQRPPARIAIIGGGPVGIEFAQILAPLGSRVTLIESAAHLLPREDEEIVAVVEKSFRRQGIDVRVGTKVEMVRRVGPDVLLDVVPVGGVAETLAFDSIMLATGKRSEISELGLDAAGVALDDRGRLVLNEYLQTTNPAIYAAGDAAGRMMYTTVAHREGAAAALNAVAGNSVIVNLTIMPRGTFCHPEVGSVGLTEKEARAANFDVAIGRAPYAALSRSLAAGDDEGLIKIIADRRTGDIIGGHIVGQAAAELVHEIALAMYAGLTVEDLSNMTHAFPTYSEGIGAAAAAVA